MKVMGVRCSNSDYAYCILSGSRESPVVEETKKVSFPKGYNEAEVLQWLHQEMRAVFSKHKCNAIGIKKAETNVVRSNALETRIQSDAIVSLAAAEAGCLAIFRKVKSTIAKDLGLKGKGKYLETKLDASAIAGFHGYSREIKEAILVGWSCM